MTPLQHLDERLFRLFNHALANPVGDWLFPLFNNAAPFIPLLVLALALLARSHSRRLWLLALALVAALALGDGLLWNPLKEFLGRPRPAATMPDVRALVPGATGGHSFPSSHTANAFAAAAILSAVFPSRRRWFLIGAAFIGFSRIYVGVHYPADVLGSALLGWFYGVVFLAVARRAWKKLEPFLPASSKPCGTVAPAARGPGPAVRTGRTFPPASWLPWLALAIIQLSRLLWAAQTELDVPPESARLWCLAFVPSPSASSLAHNLAKAWFTLFGSSPLSLWAIPWTLQTLWLVLAGWLALRRGGRPALWALALLAILIPLVSQLSFLNSPAQALADSDWESTRQFQALILNTLLAAPLWIAAVMQFRRHALCSVATLIAWILAVSFPTCPWWVPAFASTGTLVHLAVDIGRCAMKWGEPALANWRAGMTLFAIYGVIVSIAVYEPMFLRKLDISFLPRNTTTYAQTGWKACVSRFWPRILANQAGWGRDHVIWSDDPISRDQLEYLLGGGIPVQCPSDHPGPVPGDLYIQEWHFAQIHPRLIFVPKSEWLIPSSSKARPPVDGLETFRRGDPMRQFRLHQIEASAKAP